MTDFIASSIAITAFFGFITTFLIGLPFIPQIMFSNRLYIDLVVRRMCRIFGTASLLVWFTLIMTIMENDGMTIGGYAGMMVQIITLTLYVSIMYLFVKMILDLNLLVKSTRKSKSRGDQEPEDAE